MKKNYLFWVAFCVTVFSHGQSIFINEIHYKNIGGDIGEGIEIAGPTGTNLAGYKVRLYNNNGLTYSPIVYLSGIIPNQQNNRGALWFEVVLQNGPSDGFALVDDLGIVIQFLSYEGVFTATNSAAAGMTSTDIGVIESDATTPVGYSLQLTGSGSNYTDFTWFGPTTASPGALNANQTLSIVKNQIEGFSLYPNPVSEGKIVITSTNHISKQVEIYSMVGKRVYIKKVEVHETIDVSNLIAGTYMIRIEEDEKIATRKLIIR